MQIVGIIVDGEEIVVIDAAKGEHRVTTAEDLWALAKKIAGDETLPAVVVTSRPRSELDKEELDDAMQRLGDMVERAAESAYGTAAGRLAKDHVPKVAMGAVGLLQRISRRSGHRLRRRPA